VLCEIGAVADRAREARREASHSAIGCADFPQPVRALAEATAPQAVDTRRMLPLSDGIPARRFPIVTIALIAANFAVWLFYEQPHLNSSIHDASFYPCSVDGSCHAPLPWAVSWFTAMFMHASWGHILGNMLFLAIFGKNVEDSFGRLGYLTFYVAGGFVATLTQASMTLLFGNQASGQVPNLGASGAIAAVLGAYFVLYPNSRILTLVFIFPIKIRAWFFLGAWFLFQLFDANFGMFSDKTDGGGTAFFAHVGGFIFGVLIARLLVASGRIAGRDRFEAYRAAA